MMHLTCSTICYRNLPVADALRAIKAHGFAAVDFAAIPGFCPHFDAARATTSEFDALCELVASVGLAVPTVTAVPGCFDEPSADYHAIVAAGVANVRLAARLGAGVLGVNSGKPIADRSLFRDRAALQARGLAEIARAAEDHGVRLAVEAPHRNGLARTLDEAEWLLDRIGHPGAGLVIDTTHVVAGGARPEAAVRRFRGRIAHVHLRDGRGEDIFFVPGDGEVDFARFFEALHEIGYGGVAALELEGCGETTRERHAAVTRALEHLLGRAGGPVTGLASANGGRA